MEEKMLRKLEENYNTNYQDLELEDVKSESKIFKKIFKEKDT